MRRILLILAVVSLIPLASGAAFMKLGDIKGEATDRSAGEDIDVLAWSWGMSRTKGETTLGDVVVVRELDKSSTKLMSAALTDTEMLSMNLRVQASPDSFFDVFIEDVRVTSYSISGEGDVATEEVSFSYAKIQIEYREQKADGSFDTEMVSLQA